MKNQKLEAAQRQIVRDLFFIEPSFKEQLKTIHDSFRKLKPLTGISRAFKEYNKRYFILNIETMILYYTSKELYTLNDIQYVALEEVTEIRDKPHYITNTTSAQYNDAFGFTLYFHDRYVILLAKTIEVYQKWLYYLEAIRWKSSGQSILKRLRTQYIFPLISQEKTQSKESEEPKKEEQAEKQEKKEEEEQKEQNIEELKEKINQLKEQKESNDNLKQPQQEPQQKQNEVPKKQTSQELKKQSKPDIQTFKQQEESKSNIDKPQVKQSKQIDQNVLMSSRQEDQKPKQKEIKQEFKKTTQKQIVNLDNLKQQKQQQEEYTNQEENIIIIGEVQAKQVQKEEENLVRPIRLDNGRLQQKSNTKQNQQQQQYQSSYKKSNGPRDIWQNEDDCGNVIIKPTVMKSNFTQNDEIKERAQNEGKLEPQKIVFDDDEDDDFNEQDFMSNLLGIKKESVESDEKKEKLEERNVEQSNKNSEGFFLSKQLQNQSSSDDDEDNDDLLLDLDQIEQPLENVAQVESKVIKQQAKPKQQNNYDDWDDDM